MRQIILSGFSNGNGRTGDSSELVARKLNGATLAGYTIRSTLFAAAIPDDNRGELLFSKARCHGAAGIISLGTAPGKRGICIERVAGNWIGSACHPPHLRNTPIVRDERNGKKLEMDLTAWYTARFKKICARRGVAVEEDSADAGSSHGNHLIWQLRTGQLLQKERVQIPFIFLSLPCPAEAAENPLAGASSGPVFMEVREMIKGLEILLAQSLIAKRPYCRVHAEAA